MAKAPATDVIFAWPVRSSHGTTTYEVLVHSTGIMSCSCPGWVYKRKAERGCKHTDEYASEGVRILDLYRQGKPLPSRVVAGITMPSLQLATNTDGRVFLEEE